MAWLLAPGGGELDRTGARSPALSPAQFGAAMGPSAGLSVLVILPAFLLHTSGLYIASSVGTYGGGGWGSGVVGVGGRTVERGQCLRRSLCTRFPLRPSSFLPLSVRSLRSSNTVRSTSPSLSPSIPHSAFSFLFLFSHSFLLFYFFCFFAPNFCQSLRTPSPSPSSSPTPPGSGGIRGVKRSITCTALLFFFFFLPLLL